MAKMIDNPALKIQNLSAIEIERIEPIDIMGVLRTIWYGKFVIMLTTMLAIVVGGYYAFAIASPRFAAVATLRIETTSDQTASSDQLSTGQTPDINSLNTEVAILQSRHLLQRVVEEMDLTADPAFNRYLNPTRPWSLTGLRNTLRSMLTGQTQTAPDDAAVMDKTIDNLAAALSVDALRDTYIFRITASTGDPDTSARVADALARLYLADQVNAKQAGTERTFNWLAERVYDLQLDLEAKETAVNNIVTANRANDTAVLDGLSRKSIEAKDRLGDIQRALRDAQAELSSFDATVTNAALTSPIHRNRLAADVRRLRDQVTAMELFQSGINTQLADQSASLVRLQQLRREADATRVLYETFLARMQETNVQRGLQDANSRILTLAAPGKYVAPRKMLILLMAAMLGAALGVLVVLVRRALRRGFASGDVLADAIGLPVMAEIPRLPIRHPSKLLDYLAAKPTSAAAEAIRNLRTSLLLADPDKVPQVILSTSSVAGEGKTTQSIALAHNLAGLEKSVLLIEADTRCPSFTTFLKCDGVDLEPIIAGAVSVADVAVRDPRLAADILPALPMDQNPADRFSSPDFARFIKSLRKNYDFIVIDAPPVLPVPDARILAQHCDTVLYTVQWEKTDQNLIVAGQRALADVGVSIDGMVLARVDVKRMHHYGRVHLAEQGHAYYQN